MVSETQIGKTLNGFVDEFMERVPFFRVWKTGSVNSAMSEKFLNTFDSLVKSFPAIIAAGAARMEDEETRATLAVNLYQECGEGDISRTHYAIFRKFLMTAGVPISSASEMAFTVEWRNGLVKYINGASSPQAVLGALAAGEFLAQPVLTKIFAVIEPLYPGADTEYFTKHLVLEAEHVKEITTTIARLVHRSHKFEEVVDGFKLGLSVWESYFSHLTEYIAEKQVAR